MIKYTQNRKGEITKDGHTMFQVDVLKDLKRLAYLETLYAKEKELVSCRLWELDLEENWAKFEVPQAVMDKGFSGGVALIDFSGVQG